MTERGRPKSIQVLLSREKEIRFDFTEGGDSKGIPIDIDPKLFISLDDAKRAWGVE